MIYPHSIGPNETHPFLSEFKSLFELVFNSVGKNYFKHDHLPVHTFPWKQLVAEFCDNIELENDNRWPNKKFHNRHHPIIDMQDYSSLITIITL